MNKILIFSGQYLQKNNLILLLFLMIVTAVFLRIIFVDEREFWYDEVLSLLLSTSQKLSYSSPPDYPILLSSYTSLLQLPQEANLTDIFLTFENLLKGLVGEPHPPLFFITQHLWLRLFGNSEIAMRSLGVLLSLSSIIGAYALGNRVLGYRGGLLLAALLGVNPYYLFHSLNVRMYGVTIFWVIISSWLLLELIDLNKNQNKKTLKLIMTLAFIGAVTAGLMSLYYFAIWLICLFILTLLLDKQHFFYYTFCFVSSIIITIPWLWWGTRQQLRNADFHRFNTSFNWIETIVKHIQDVIQVLGIHLILGDWITSLPLVTATIAGIAVIAVFSLCIFKLWQKQQYQVLAVGLCLGILPLLLMLMLDVFMGKFTLSYGWGRAVIFILPGCLLLITIGIGLAAKKWQELLIITVLLLYLTVSVADFTLRPRWIFHQVADIINQQPNTSTLIVMNSQAWGHVLRLAYYLPVTSPLYLLAQNSKNLTSVLANTLKTQGTNYDRILWLDSARPVWGSASTDIQKQQVKKLLETDFKLETTQQLTGTGQLDKFTVQLYNKIFR
jgi:uncharacterized membrane protein